MPPPGRLHNVLQRIPGLPTKLTLNQGGIRHQHGRIADSPGRFHSRYRSTRHFSRHLNHFAHRMAVSGAHIESSASHSRYQRFQCQYVCFRQIQHVDVVTDGYHDYFVKTIQRDRSGLVFFTNSLLNTNIHGLMV